MRHIRFAGAVLALFAVTVSARAAEDDPALLRMAMCKDSWFEWQKTAPDKLKAFGEHFRTMFVPHSNDPYFLPKKDVFVGGMKVVRVFPDSVGMAVGFSITVGAPFDIARKAMEKRFGKLIGKCESGDNMKMCALDIADKRTFTIASDDDPKSAQTLIGCYYFYEK